jgi:predicted SprT family Zn-dependent metalloprotease
MNKLIEIRKFAAEQMEKWGLIEENWTFVWDNRAISRYGQCRYGKKEIGITKKLALINTIEESKDVVLHEIAHALTGRGHGHDHVWKRMCRKVGAKPERCYKPKDRGGSVNTIQGKYKLVNKDTGKVYRYYHRRPKNKDWSTRWLIGKKAETYGKLQVVANQINNTDSSPYKIKS